MNGPLRCYECHALAAGHVLDFDDCDMGRDLVCRVHGVQEQRAGRRVEWLAEKQLDEVVACERCGGMRVECESWVDINRDVPTDSIDSSSHWCPRCQDHVDVMMIARVDGGWSYHSGIAPVASLRDAIRAVRTIWNRRRIS